jgi:CheY-like chemotaxis protein
MKLLLAEDDAMLADALQTQLRGAGFTVEHAPNGAVADYLLQKESFDIAVLDLGLPMMDGLAVLQHVRQTQPGLPVLLLTARDSLDDRVAGLNYTLLMPRIKINGAAVPVAGPTSRLITIPFVALRDSSTGTQLRITRTTS